MTDGSSFDRQVLGEIVVADNGEGITPEFLPHVFDRFRQADPSFTRKAGGLGLGLAIVRSLVELHGGEVSAHSPGPSQGASFVVRLPMAPFRSDVTQQRSTTPTQPVRAPAFECPAALRGVSVLVVDDEPGTCELLAFVLEQCAVDVVTTSSAQEALGTLSERRFDLMISDVGMPGEDGYALVHRVRALDAPTSRMPALALTAYARGEDRMAALRAGFDMHLAKPIDPGELLVVLETMLRSAAASDAD